MRQLFEPKCLCECHIKGQTKFWFDCCLCECKGQYINKDGTVDLIV